MNPVTFSVFPTGFRGLSRIIAPQAIDTVYVKGHKSKLYVVSRFALRGEQQAWAIQKFKKPTIDEAWDLSAMAKGYLIEFAEKRKRRKRGPTWKEMWLAQELAHLRSLALEWMSYHEDVSSRKVFLLDTFLSKGITEVEKEAVFVCPDGAVPAIVIDSEWGTQSTGNLWINEDWESADAVELVPSTYKNPDMPKEDLIQKMWRFIPEDIYLYCQLTQDPPTARADIENLADIDEVLRREDALQYAIQNRRLRQKQQANLSSEKA